MLLTFPGRFFNALFISNLPVLSPVAQATSTWASFTSSMELWADHLSPVWFGSSCTGCNHAVLWGAGYWREALKTLRWEQPYDFDNSQRFKKKGLKKRRRSKLICQHSEKRSQHTKGSSSSVSQPASCFETSSPGEEWMLLSDDSFFLPFNNNNNVFFFVPFLLRSLRPIAWNKKVKKRKEKSLTLCNRPLVLSLSSSLCACVLSVG